MASTVSGGVDPDWVCKIALFRAADLYEFVPQLRRDQGYDADAVERLSSSRNAAAIAWSLGASG